MSVGTWIGDQFSNLTGQSLPMYVGSMFVAVALKCIRICEHTTHRFETE